MIDLLLYLNHVLASAVLLKDSNKLGLLVRIIKGANREVNFFDNLKI